MKWLRLREVGRVLSRKNEDRLRAALSELSDVLSLAVPDGSDVDDTLAAAVGEAFGLKLVEKSLDELNYREATAGGPACATCKAFVDGKCTVADDNPPVKADWVCDSYVAKDASLTENLVELFIETGVVVGEAAYDDEGEDEIDAILDMAEALFSDEEMLALEEGDDAVDEAWVKNRQGSFQGSTKGGSRSGGGTTGGKDSAKKPHTLAGHAGETSGPALRAMAKAKMAHVKALLKAGKKLTKTQLKRAIRAKQTLKTGRVPTGAEVRSRLRAGHSAGLGRRSGVVRYGGKESASSDDSAFVLLNEASAVSSDGMAPIKLISPGWGSSGYYHASVLERDGPKVFKKGTKMFWDHPTAADEEARPERSLRDLAAELTEDARWDPIGPTDRAGKVRGPGLYAQTKVFGPYRESVNELAPHIGVSIRALGKASDGEAEGKKGRIIEGLASAKSVDFVTSPGRGGEILQLFEAARDRAYEALNESQEGDGDSVSEAELKEARERAETAEKENAGLRESLAHSSALTFVARLVGASDLPASAKTRLHEALAADPPVDKQGKLDEAALKTRVDKAIVAEAKYIEELTGKTGGVHGMGGSALDESDKDDRKTAGPPAELVEAFKGLGMSDTAAAIAAGGRA